MATATVPVPAGADGELSHKQIMTILWGLILGMFLAALDQTVVATATRTIGDELNGLSVQAWITTAFLITSTISTPLYGKLSDIYGRKPLFMIAITVFIAGSAMCAFAQSMYMLAGFRAFQGLGAGGLISLALAIIGDIIPPRRRGKYQAYFVGTLSISSVLGPVVGGFFAGQASFLTLSGWRWIFLINVPLGLVTLVVVNRSLQLPRRRLPQRIDWVGAAALVLSVVPLLLIAEQGRLWGWDSPVAFACYALGALGIVGFLVNARRMGDASLIPLRLFSRRTFALGSVHAVVVGMLFFGAAASLPLYLQLVHGATPTQSGLLMLPFVAGMVGGSLVSAQVIARTGKYKINTVVGSSLLAVGFALLSQLGADSTFVHAGLCMLVLGVGIGGNTQTMVVAMQNAVPARDMGVASSSNTFFRQLGATLGTAVFLSILFSTAGGNINDAFRSSGATPPVPIGAVLDDSSVIGKLSADLAHPYQVGFASSLDLVYLCAAFIAIIAVVISLLLKNDPLRTMSGNQARATAAARIAAERLEAERLEAERFAAEQATSERTESGPTLEPLAGRASAEAAGEPVARSSVS